jgi:uncharacterized protein (DUF305 family)
MRRGAHKHVVYDSLSQRGTPHNIAVTTIERTTSALRHGQSSVSNAASPHTRDVTQATSSFAEKAIFYDALSYMEVFVKPRLILSSAVVVLGAALVLGACSSGMNMGSGTTTSADTPVIATDADFNAADVSFAQEMIVHHTQAIAMADVALERTQNPEIRQIATAIKAAQDPEIAQMSSWLTLWGQPLPDMNAGMTTDGMGAMTSGTMMAGPDMSMLQNTSGAAFDQMFLQMMITHHQEAIDMAKKALNDGQYQPAKDLAQQIIRAQTAEIAQMQTLLDASPS